MNPRFSRQGSGWLALVLAALCTVARAADYPPGFYEEVAFDGLTAPMAVSFAPDGRIFVAEKSGTVRVFDDLDDPVSDVLIDLGQNVHDYWDRGLLGLAVDPGFPIRPYVYLLYTLNANPLDPESGFPAWPDACPDPPGALGDGCVVNGRLSRLTVSGTNNALGSEKILLEGFWCAQYPSHTVGDLAFDSEGALWVSAGDGARFSSIDYGQGGGSPDSPTPANPCGDPPLPIGQKLSLPEAEGGALRAQDVRTPDDDISYDGAILRVDPDTGAAWPTNPGVGGDGDLARIVGYGLRNPFRVAARPGTNELWVGDVGWATWEEINRIADPTTGPPSNFGWPCYEGPAQQPEYMAAGLDLCTDLYADELDPALPPVFGYLHEEQLPATEGVTCSREGSSAIAGLAFYTGVIYPARFGEALFFLDYSRSCLYAILADETGLPDPSTVRTIGDALSFPVHLSSGPDGHLYYVDALLGRIMRIRYENAPPRAVLSADRTDGSLPLDVRFDASGSFDLEHATGLTYAWDLDGDGAYDDSTAAMPGYTYDARGRYTVGLEVTDPGGLTDLATIEITAGNNSPQPTILTPDPSLEWEVGQTIAFSGSAQDLEDGSLGRQQMRWDLLLHHCPGGGSDCHPHLLQSFEAVDSGSFVAPDHEWYSFLELRLSVEDRGFAQGQGGELTGSTSRAIEPRTVMATFESEPSGLVVSVGDYTAPTPFVQPMIVGSTVTLAVPSPQESGGNRQRFFYWSDGGAQSHEVIAPDNDARWTAHFAFECLGFNCRPVLRVDDTPSAVAPFGSVQEAIDAVITPGTTVEVLPGTYVENVVVSHTTSFALVARDDGSGGPVILEGGSGAALEFPSAANASVYVAGVILRGQTGIHTSRRTTVENVRFESIAGTALDLELGDHRVRGARFDSTVTHGVRVGADATLDLSRSRLEGLSGHAVEVAGQAEVRNALIASAFDGVVVRSGGSLDLRHSTVAMNQGAGLVGDGGSLVTVGTSILWGNGGGDLVGVDCSVVHWSDVGSPDCSPTGQNVRLSPDWLADFSLAPTSPLTDIGPAPGELAMPCRDLAGDLRLRDFDGNGVPHLDLGAFEARDSLRPLEVADVRFADGATLTWGAVDGAIAYHVYRGNLADVATPGSGLCLDDRDADLSDLQLIDAEVPSSGAGLFYLVTSQDDTGAEGTPGAGTCRDRSGFADCPTLP